MAQLIKQIIKALETSKSIITTTLYDDDGSADTEIGDDAIAQIDTLLKELRDE